MDTNPLFAMLDPATDQFLWACAGPTPRGRCPIAESPPYVCQGLRLVAVRGTDQDGRAFTVDRTVAGRCPAAGSTGH